MNAYDPVQNRFTAKRKIPVTCEAAAAATIESTDRVRLTWQGETGRLYGVQSTLNVANGPWTRVTLSSGTTILATNALIEATFAVPSSDPQRFFRVLEANCMRGNGMENRDARVTFCRSSLFQTRNLL